MAEKLAKRFEGREKEILRDVRLYGVIGAMNRWRASYIAWTRYLRELNESNISVEEERHSRESAVPQAGYDDKYFNNLIKDNEKQVEKEKRINKVQEVAGLQSYPAIENPLLYYREKSLAVELVEAFVSQVVRLKSENEELKEKLMVLENKIVLMQTDADRQLADKVINALEVLQGSENKLRGIKHQVDVKSLSETHCSVSISNEDNKKY